LVALFAVFLSGKCATDVRLLFAGLRTWHALRRAAAIARRPPGIRIKRPASVIINHLVFVRRQGRRGHFALRLLVAMETMPNRRDW